MSASEEDNFENEIENKSEDSFEKNDSNQPPDEEFTEEQRFYGGENLPHERSYQARPMRYMSGMPYMRPPRNGPPFDFPRGMNRGPPRYPHRFPGHGDHEMEELGNRNQQMSEFDGPPGPMPNFSPNMRMRGPPPFMPPNMSGPPGPPPFQGAPPGPPNQPPFASPNQCSGPNYNMPPDSQPPQGFQGPPFPGQMPFNGPPGPPPFGPPSGAYQQGPPVSGASFQGPPPGPPPFAPSGFPPGPPGPFAPGANPPNSTPGPMPPTGFGSLLSDQPPQNMSGPPQPILPNPSTPQSTGPEQPLPPNPSFSNAQMTPPASNQTPLLASGPPPMDSANAQPPELNTHTGIPPNGLCQPPNQGPPATMPHFSSSNQEYNTAPRPPFTNVGPSPGSMPPPMIPPPGGMPGFPPNVQSFRPPMPPPQFMSMPNAPMPPPSQAPSKGPDDIWVENLTAEGKSYYYNMRTRETRWTRPDGVPVVRQGEMERQNNPPVSSTPTSTNSAPEKPSDVAAWSEYHNSEGKPYYHNARTGETTWDKPKALVDWESFASGRQQVSTSSLPPPSTVSAPINTTNTMPVAQKAPEKELDHPKQAEPIVALSNDTTTTEVRSEPAKENKEQTKTKDSTRPISSTAVTGTPWCVVWTGDDRAFFFNPSQRISVWEKPEELKGRVDVDRLLERRPDPTSNSESPEKVLDSENGESAAKKQRLDSDSVVTVVNNDHSDITTAQSNGTVIDNKPGPNSDKIPAGMESAKEAEERAARERAAQPLEVRMRRFREMLIEMQVSAFSTWEKELHKIVFDPRYLLLASKERKQAFESYVKERAEEERREKKSKLKERKDKFTELLEEANLSSRASFSDFTSKYGKDDRFKGIEKSRDREAIFQDYVTDIRKREKEEKHKEKEKIKADFMNLLKEQKNLTRHSHWSDLKRKIDNDPRYKAVDSGSRREDWFRDHVKKLDETPVREDSSSRKEREKRERQEASIREREKEVKESLSSSLRERDKERDNHLRTEQEDNFRAMLTELIRDSASTWKEAKKILRKDNRWDAVADVIPRDEREDFFKDHIAFLSKRGRDQKRSDTESERRSLVDVTDE